MSGFFNRFVRINRDITDTVNSIFDGQNFLVARNTSVDTDGEAAFNIDNDRVDLRNLGDINSNNAPATVDISGRDADVVNLRSASITAESDDGTSVAIDITGSADIRNFGDIDADLTAVDFSGPDAGGSLFNSRSGTISSDSRAVAIDGRGVQVRNFGDIVGTGNQRNGTVYSNDTAFDFLINNSRRATIDAGEGNEGAAVSLSLSTEEDVNATIVNRGDIVGRGNAGAGAATAGDGIRIETVREGGALGANSGTFVGRILNFDDISSEGANGTVAGFRTVNGVDFQGTLTNFRTGEISGTQNGVYFGNATPAGGGDHTGGVVNNFGRISSDSRAFNIDGTGLVVNNEGRIEATATQRNGTVYADSTAQDFVLNNLQSGVIDAGEGLEGAAFSVELDEAGNNFTINNEGEILGRGNAGAGVTQAGDGIRLERTRVAGALDGTTTGLFTGTISNSGSIISEGANGTVAGFRAVNGVSFQGTLINEAGGLIAGVQNGVYFGNPTPAGGGDHTGGAFINQGTVSSGSRALNIDGNGLTIVNDGDILGTDTQRNGTVYTDATANNYFFLNTENGVVDAGDGNDGSGVSLQTGDEVNAVIINEGLFQGRGDSDVANEIGHGLRLFQGAGEDSSFNGIIINTGEIFGSQDADNEAGVSIEGVALNGALVNFGTIGGSTGIDASTALGVNIVNGGLIEGDVILSAEGDVFVLVAGGEIDGIVDAGAGIDTLALVGFSADEAEELLNSDQFIGFENVITSDDSFDFTSALSSSDVSFENVVSDLVAELGPILDLPTSTNFDSIFETVESTDASEFLFG